ncbi:tetraspanin-36-like [Diadema setosum]|uniref:tetraspanin-36-like n=1 Tax=Diadema setosum TaxID=31175 RepID=UPI003B3BE6B9
MKLFKCCSVALSAKCVMFFLSVLFWCASAALMYLGVELFRCVGNIKHVASNYFLTIPAMVSIGLSLLFCVVGIVGLTALSWKDAKCLKRMFLALLVIIVVLEITGASLAIVYKDEVSVGIEKGVNETMATYDSSDNSKTFMDWLQSHLGCCGAEQYQDWFTTQWGKDHPSAVPESCCSKKSVLPLLNSATNCTGALPDDVDRIYHASCHDRLYQEPRKYLVYVIVVAVILFLLEVLALICTCYLVCNRRDKKQYQHLQTSEHESSYGYRA